MVRQSSDMKYAYVNPTLFFFPFRLYIKFTYVCRKVVNDFVVREHIIPILIYTTSRESKIIEIIISWCIKCFSCYNKVDSIPPL